MRGEAFSVAVPGGHVDGWVDGDGVPVLMLHGGPGLSYDYLEDLADEIGPGHRVASFQQRGLAPSMLDGPFDIDTHLSDIAAVLDSLGWPAAVIVGHSWGGHLGYHFAAAMPERATAVLCIDPLGAVGDGGDGGEAEFSAEMQRRAPEETRTRAAELDARAMAGEGTVEDALESLRLFWPAYFASWDAAPPMPEIGISVDAYAGTFVSIHERLLGLETALPGITVPVGIVVGGSSPIPTSQAHGTASAIAGAWVEVVADAGHFPWFERPGSVRSALARLTA